VTLADSRLLVPSRSGEKERTGLHRNYKWHVVGMLWCISFFNYADRQAIFSVFPLLEKEMGLNTVELGLLGSSFAWVYGLAAPLAGLIVDRIKRTSAILWGLQIWSIICVATASARNFWHLFIFRAAEGLGESIYYPASMSLVSDYHGKETRSRAMGMHQTSVYIGTIAGGFFAGLIGQYYGWRWSFIVFGGLGIILGLLLRKLLVEPERGATEEVKTVQKKMPAMEIIKLIFSKPTALCLMLAFMSANFVAVVLLSWMPKFLYDKFGMSLATAGLTATIFVQLASMAGSPVGGWLGVFCGAPFVVLCGLTESTFWLIVALTAWGFFKGLYDANIFASLFDVVPPETRGSAAGWMNTIGWLGGGGSAPLVIGWIAQDTGLGVAIALAAGVYVIAGLALTAGFGFFAKRDVLAPVR
jgi:MFS family permease